MKAIIICFTGFIDQVVVIKFIIVTVVIGSHFLIVKFFTNQLKSRHFTNYHSEIINCHVAFVKYK